MCPWQVALRIKAPPVINKKDKEETINLHQIFDELAQGNLIRNPTENNSQKLRIRSGRLPVIKVKFDS